MCGVCIGDNQTSDEYYKQGLDLAKNGQYEEAIAAYDKAIKINQSFVDSWTGKGNAYQSLKQFSDAIQAYEMAITLNPKDITAWMGKGNSLKSLKKDDEALVAFNKVIDLDTNKTAAYQGKGDVLLNLKRYDEAIPVYDKAIELNHASVSLYLSKASALQNIQKYDDALNIYDQVIAINSSYIPAYTGKAGVLSKQKRYSEALNMYDLAIKKDPGAIWAWNERGNVLQTLKRYDEAVSSFDHVIALNETYAPAWRNKANVLKILKKNTEAMEAYDQALANDPFFFSAWMDKGNLHISLNNSQDALESFDQAIQINQTDAAPWNAKGKIYMGKEQYSDAVTAFSQAIKLNPNVPDGQKNLENAQFKVFQVSDAPNNSTLKPEDSDFQGEKPSTSRSESGTATSVQDNWFVGIWKYIFGDTHVYSSSPGKDATCVPNQVKLLSPVDVSLNNNSLLIADEGNLSVIRSDYSGTINLIIGGSGQPGVFSHVTSVTSDSKGNIYILDGNKAKIFKFDDMGRLLLSWGSQGSEPGQFNNPGSIDYFPRSGYQDGILSIADTGNNRIQLFDLNGEYISSLTELHADMGSSFLTRGESQVDLAANARSYHNITLEENANPPFAERTFNTHIKDTTSSFSIRIDRRMFLGAQKSTALNFNVNDKNPEQWEESLKGSLLDPVTEEIFKETSSLLNNGTLKGTLSESERLDLLCTFIQQIPLVNESDMRYPIEVLYDKKASSSDKALFLYGLLYQAGYDVVFLSYPGTNHCGIGIRVDISAQNPAMKEYIIDDHSYVYVNPDTPDIIGRLSSVYNDVDPLILHLLPQDGGHSLTLPEREKRLTILETLDKVTEKQKFIVANKGKYSSAAKKQMQDDLDKIKAVKQFVEDNTWNTEGISMRLGNSKVGDLQLMYGK